MRPFQTSFALTVTLLGCSVALAQGDLQQSLAKALNKKNFSGVHATVQGSVAVLSGTVQVFDDKQQAAKRASKVKGITDVDNEIQVGGPSVPDPVLEQKILRAVEYDRVGYGSTAFNAIAVRVQNGIVTLGGHAVGPVSAQSAVNIAGTTPGVRGVVDHIAVDPLSPMDNRIRIDAFRSIYGFPSLNRYAADPAKPIRISVQNGIITLYGVVDSQADKETAGIRANTVPGAFHVTNNLQVANGGESAH